MTPGGMMQGMMPGTMQGMMPGMMMPGMMPGMMEGLMPGMMEGMMPGMMEGMMPEMMEGMMPGMMEGMMPGMMEGMMPGMMEGMMPGMAGGTMPAVERQTRAINLCTVLETGNVRQIAGGVVVAVANQLSRLSGIPFRVRRVGISCTGGSLAIALEGTFSFVQTVQSGRRTVRQFVPYQGTVRLSGTGTILAEFTPAPRQVHRAVLCVGPLQVTQVTIPQAVARIPAAVQQRFNAALAMRGFCADLTGTLGPAIAPILQ